MRYFFLLRRNDLSYILQVEDVFEFTDTAETRSSPASSVRSLPVHELLERTEAGGAPERRLSAVKYTYSRPVRSRSDSEEDTRGSTSPEPFRRNSGKGHRDSARSRHNSSDSAGTHRDLSNGRCESPGSTRSDLVLARRGRRADSTVSQDSRSDSKTHRKFVGSVHSRRESVGSILSRRESIISAHSRRESESSVISRRESVDSVPSRRESVDSVHSRRDSRISTGSSRSRRDSRRSIQSRDGSQVSVRSSKLRERSNSSSVVSIQSRDASFSGSSRSRRRSPSVRSRSSSGSLRSSRSNSCSRSRSRSSSPGRSSSAGRRDTSPEQEQTKPLPIPKLRIPKALIQPLKAADSFTRVELRREQRRRRIQRTQNKFAQKLRSLHCKVDLERLHLKVG